MKFRTENIEISGEAYTIKVPEDEIYVDANYEETQASKTIYPNLTDELREKISLTQIESILNFQGNYIQNQQKANPDFEELGNANIKFLKERIESLGRSLSKDEVLEIFHAETFYMKLINIID